MIYLLSFFIFLLFYIYTMSEFYNIVLNKSKNINPDKKNKKKDKKDLEKIIKSNKKKLKLNEKILIPKNEDIKDIQQVNDPIDPNDIKIKNFEEIEKRGRFEALSDIDYFKNKYESLKNKNEKMQKQVDGLNEVLFSGKTRHDKIDKRLTKRDEIVEKIKKNEQKIQNLKQEEHDYHHSIKNVNDLIKKPAGRPKKNKNDTFKY